MLLCISGVFQVVIWQQFLWLHCGLSEVSELILQMIIYGWAYIQSLYIYILMHIWVYIHICSEQKKKKQKRCLQSTKDLLPWLGPSGNFCEIKYFCCSCTQKLVLEPKVHKVQEYFQFKSYQYKCWSCSGYHLLYFIYM